MDNEEWDNYSSVTDNDEKKPKRRKIIVLILVIIILLSIIGAIVSYGTLILKMVKKIFPYSAVNYNQAYNLVSREKLKGEDSGDVNILLLGMRGEDERYPKLTNGTMVINYDVGSKKINIISLPRDLWVSTDKYGYRKISYICDTKEYDKNPLSCFDTGQEVIKKTLDIDVNYGFLADFKGFVQMLDETNTRIDVNVGDHYKDWPFLQEKSFTNAKDAKNSSVYHLNSEQSLIFVRWPKDALPDFDRLYRQQIFVKAAQDKLFSNQMLFNPVKVQQILQIAGNNLVTDMQVWEAVRFAQMVKDIPASKINKYSLTSIFGTNGGLLRETSFDGATLSPAKGDSDYSQISSWAESIIAK